MNSQQGYSQERVYGSMPPPTKKIGRCWHCSGRRMYALDLDGQPFAIKCPLCSGSGQLVYEIRE